MEEGISEDNSESRHTLVHHAIRIFVEKLGDLDSNRYFESEGNILIKKGGGLRTVTFGNLNNL